MGFSIRIREREFGEGEVESLGAAIDEKLSTNGQAAVWFEGDDKNTYVGGVSRLAEQQVRSLIKHPHKSWVKDIQNEIGVTDNSVIVYSSSLLYPIKVK